MLARIALAAVIALWSSIVSAESVQFKLFALQPEGGRKLVAEGVRKYSPAKDIEVVKTEVRDGSVFWSKRLPLAQGYELEAHITKERKLDGFGLAVNERNSQTGFSWNWFDHADGDIFTRRRGAGRLKVSYIRSGGYVELGSVEFLEDIALRYTDDMTRTPPGQHTHELVISKGSIFRVAP